MALSDFNKNREVLKIKNYKEFIAQEKLKKPEWLKIRISPNRQTIKEVKNLLASNILSTVCRQFVSKPAARISESALTINELLS